MPESATRADSASSERVCRLGFWTGLFVGIQKLAGAELDEKGEPKFEIAQKQLKKERKEGKESSKNKKTTELGLS
jgi:hypothetical protein